MVFRRQMYIRNWSKSIGWGGPKQRGGGWVISFWALGKGWVVQFSATRGGWVILFYNRNRHTFIRQPAREISIDKESNIQAFSEKCAVDQEKVVKYLHHLLYLT